MCKSLFIMDIEEVQYLSENEYVSIVPNFSHPVIHLIKGSVGPFQPTTPLNVPLWMAIHLKESHRCRFICPEWLTYDTISTLLKAEQQNEHFTPMPNRFIFILSQTIMSVALEDIPNGDNIRLIMKDLWDLRLAKLRTSIDSLIKSGALYAKVTHLTTVEICLIRNFLKMALKQIYQLQQVIPDE
ncbi:unnamed protein product [Didymodactylos carnosus]|uniref:GINS complex subunit 2 n=1 Tax=Didymodactylos carnosus TaxID=1234261 RepID=A0A814BBK0_9BILA|nr:unnamed protein product [Didymodactylos carnosus]CAF0925864.1 unnamed protein product [Didymodactylos carnosus]CAF3547517.1 unnamed protein product [Didymodactylos carnosus]CAF3704490.1 unnamed protein product [Didymodactylos carnosus]